MLNSDRQTLRVTHARLGAFPTAAVTIYINHIVLVAVMASQCKLLHLTRTHVARARDKSISNKQHSGSMT